MKFENDFITSSGLVFRHSQKVSINTWRIYHLDTKTLRMAINGLKLIHISVYTHTTPITHNHSRRNCGFALGLFLSPEVEKTGGVLSLHRVIKLRPSSCPKTIVLSCKKTIYPLLTAYKPF